MLDEKNIKVCLKEYIKQGIKKFIIYPFGVNGVKVRDILRDYYNLKPILVVDNEYAKYNSHIEDFETLKKQYSEDAYIILTIEDEETNKGMLNELQRFVSWSHIINLNEFKRKEADLSNFYIEKFLPDAVRCNQLNRSRTIHRENTDKRVKVRFVNYSGSTWNSIKTICLAFQIDNFFDVLIILGDYIQNDILQQIEEYGFTTVKSRDYCIQKDSPDILILNHPYDTTTQIENCREYCKLIVVASMQLIRYSYDMKSFWDLQIKGFGRFCPDYYLFDSLLYNEIMQSEYASDRFVEMGNAKFDGIYEACKEKHYPKGWGKLKGKRVVLWTTDHGIYDNHVSYELTFDLYAKTIFQYAKENQEVGIIFRPHTTFINEMLKNGFWSGNDLEALKKFCYESANLVFDDTIAYDNAFAVADGILVDAFCGITCSALPTLKPICLTYRNRFDSPYHEELAKCYDSAYNNDDIIAFMDKVKNNQDTSFELRNEACNKYIKHFDGKNGWRIKEFIKKKYIEMN